MEFLRGYIEDVPLPDDSVDVVISNCVINLSTDKPRVVDEMFRVLRPGGRLGITSDVVSDDRLSPADRAERGSYVGCIAGALSFSEYGPSSSARASSWDVPTHELTDGIHSAIVRGAKPQVSWRHTEVLFVCVHNAGRSQMAAGLLDHHAKGRIVVRSAGSAPTDEINPAVVQAMGEIDIGIAIPEPLTDSSCARPTW